MTGSGQPSPLGGGSGAQGSMNGGGGPMTPERKGSGSGLADKSSPAPPTVVVSGAPNIDMPQDPVALSTGTGGVPSFNAGSATSGNINNNSTSSPINNNTMSPSRTGTDYLGVGQNQTTSIERRNLDGSPVKPPGPLNRLRAGPKDTIPIVGKSPRKQRSSRFHVTEHVELEKLPNFMGE